MVRCRAPRLLLLLAAGIPTAPAGGGAWFRGYTCAGPLVSIGVHQQAYAEKRCKAPHCHGLVLTSAAACPSLPCPRSKFVSWHLCKSGPVLPVSWFKQKAGSALFVPGAFGGYELRDHATCAGSKAVLGVQTLTYALRKCGATRRCHGVTTQKLGAATPRTEYQRLQWYLCYNTAFRARSGSTLLIKPTGHRRRTLSSQEPPEM